MRVVVSLHSVTNDSWKKIDTDLAASLHGIRLFAPLSSLHIWMELIIGCLALALQ